jgi:hypothetical protein
MSVNKLVYPGYQVHRFGDGALTLINNLACPACCAIQHPRNADALPSGGMRLICPSCHRDIVSYEPSIAIQLRIADTE